MRRFTLFFMSLAVCTFIYGQQTWSLERCIRHALEHSLVVRGSELHRDFAHIGTVQARHNRFPSLNASSGVGLNFGRVINPATNNFETENSIFNQWSLGSGFMLFQGGLVNNSIRQSQLDLQASEEDVLQARHDLALQVALSYLNVLFAEENLLNAQTRAELTRRQLEQIDMLIAAGARPAGDRYDILAQVAIDAQEIVRYENDREINLLGLKQLMMLEAAYPLNIERPVIDIASLEAVENYSVDAVYIAALNSQPQVRAQQHRIQSALTGEDVARASFVPRLTLSASIATNYSDLAKHATGHQSVRTQIPGVFINGESVLYEVEQVIPTGIEATPVFTQYENNLGYGFSLQLSIPIYNNYSARAGLERARIGSLQQQNAGEQIHQSLKSDVQNALALARAARGTLNAAELSIEAARIA